jgi:thiosulfate/3-mercaptopyruvate sulfurtransferase
MGAGLLLSARELQATLDSSAQLIVDCRFALSTPESGYREYLQAHIPGAFYAHLDNDLSSTITGTSGRHPLPDADRFAAFLARIGWRPGTRLVVYDNADGAIAARLWWLMKYFGHGCAALLDGGFKAWLAAGYATESGQAPVRATAPVALSADSGLLVTTGQVLANLAGSGFILADVRAAERFRGEIEPLDPVAGHVPGAVSYPLQLNLLPDGRFKTAAEIHDGLSSVLGGRPASELVFMCGSGVTACHGVFAAELAGLTQTKVYAGSWSEWIRDPARPVEPKPAKT